jgi:hypothetical protein
MGAMSLAKVTGWPPLTSAAPSHAGTAKNIANANCFPRGFTMLDVGILKCAPWLDFSAVELVEASQHPMASDYGVTDGGKQGVRSSCAVLVVGNFEHLA